MTLKISIIITTTDKKEVAQEIASYLIQSNLAACAQIDEILSFFKWEGKLSQEKEFRIMIKAPSENYIKIEKAIKTHHNYSLPQIIKIDIAAGSKEYLDWIVKS